MNSTGIAMNSTQITTPLPDILKSRLAKGHMGGKEVNLAFLPEVLQPTGAANDLLKYLAANMGLIHTKIDDILQYTHLVRHEETTISNSSATDTLLPSYIGLVWNILTNLGTEVINHGGSINGYLSLIAFNPTKHLGLVILCSCDERDAMSPENWPNFAALYLLRPALSQNK